MGSVLGGVMAATGHPGMRTDMKINQQMASSNIHEQLKQQGLEQGKSDAEAEKYADQQTDAFSAMPRIRLLTMQNAVCLPPPPLPLPCANNVAASM